MRLHSRPFVLAFVALSLSSVVYATDDQFRWQGSISQGRAIEIKGVNGSISAEPATGNQVEVVADKHGRRSDPKTVQIQVVDHADGVTICAIYPSDNPNRPNECRPGEGGRNNTRNNDVQVDFTVRVPSGIRFVGRNVNGDVTAEGLGSDIEARTVNGSIRASSAGQVQGKTVNGSIVASLGNGTWNGSLVFETVNGGLTVQLPQGTNADVEAQTVNGNISTDFPLTISGSFSGKRINGRIGQGGRTLHLQTVNGSIKIQSH